MKRAIRLMSMVLAGVLMSYGQAAGDFRSATSGNWSATATWETFDGSSWSAAVAAPSSTDGVITILNGHTVTVDAATSADQVVVNSGGTLTIASGITLTIANGAGTDLSVSGTVIRTGTLTLTGTMSVENGGVYQHNVGTGLPTATWNTGSTCLVTGVVAQTSMSGSSQAFHHLTWNCTSQTGTCQLGMTSGTVIGGNLTINSTGSGKFRFVSLAASDNKTVTINGNFVVNSGTVEATGSGVAGTVNIVVNGNMTIAGGSYFAQASSATGNLNLGGDLTISSGTISKGSGAGTVNFTKSGIQNFTKSGGTITGSGSNLTFNVNNGSTVALGTSVIDGAAIFTVSSGGGLSIGSVDGITSSGATGNIQLTGTRTYSSTGNYEYSGSSAQVTGNGLPATVNNLTINNAAGVTLTSGETVSGTLALTNGVLTLGGNNLTVSALSGGSSSAYVDASGAGEYRAVISANGTKSFPVGDATNYSPASVAMTGSAYSAAYIGAKVTAAKHPSNTSTTDYLARYWTLSSSGITDPSYTATLTYVNGDVNGTESGIVGGFYNGSAWSMLDAVNTGSNTFTASSLTTFGALTGGEPAAMPVEIASFTATALRGNVELRWSTATEVNNKGFQVEKKVNGTWSSLGFVNGAGTSNERHEYSYTDQNVKTAASYRLKQVDRDGNTHYSTVVDAQAPALTAADFGLSQNYPNPFNPATTLTFALHTSQKATVKVYDMLGKEVASLFNGMAEANQLYTLRFDASHLPSGIYFYALQSAGQTEIKKMTLLK